MFDMRAILLDVVVKANELSTHMLVIRA